MKHSPFQSKFTDSLIHITTDHIMRLTCRYCKKNVSFGMHAHLHGERCSKRRINAEKLRATRYSQSYRLRHYI